MASRRGKYTATMQKRADKYLPGGYEEQEEQCPSLKGLAKLLGVDRSTLLRWARKHEQFFSTLERCGDVQHRIVLAMGLTGELPESTARLILRNHGYTLLK